MKRARFLALMVLVASIGPLAAEPSGPAPATGSAPAAKPATAGTPTQTAKPAPAAPKTFDTPEAAFAALVEAAGKFDEAALRSILGQAGAALALTRDRVQDRNQAQAFAAMAREKSDIERDPDDPSRATLLVGADAWPMPIPVVQKEGTWRFDAQQGRWEILYRRIGANELDAIEVCRGFVEAQHEYALTPHDGAHQYAQRIVSLPGKQDGLAWQAADGTWQGPIAENVARVIAEGYTSRYQPYRGYYFKILKGQGPAAPLGTLNFVVDGVMIGGFALAAAPAEYAVTGVKTFIVSHDGIVHEKDLGPKTLETFKSMQRYNPDTTWTAVED